MAVPFRWVGRLLLSSVRLRREGANLSIRLVPREAMQAGVDDRDAADARRLQAGLEALLDMHPLSRHVWRQLALFEVMFAAHGLKALMKMPLEAVTAALEQLEDLLGDGSNGALVELRSKMAAAVADRSAELFHGRSGERLSEFDTDSRVFVDEATHSMFMEIERQYDSSIAARTAPPGIAPIRLEFAPTFPPTEPFEPDFAPTQPLGAEPNSLLFMR